MAPFARPPATHFRVVQRRVPPGSPGAGRFAAGPHAEATIDLAATSLPTAVTEWMAARPGVAPSGSVVELPVTNDTTAAVTVGTVDTDAVTAYTNGQCHALALALAERTGWPLVAIGHPEPCHMDDCPVGADGMCDCQIEHVAVQRPDGSILDIEGVSPRSAYVDDDDPDFDELFAIAPERLEKLAGDGWASWPDPDLVTARGFVDVVLAGP